MIKILIIILSFVYIGSILYCPLIYIFFRLASKAIYKSYFEEINNIKFLEEDLNEKK